MRLDAPVLVEGMTPAQRCAKYGHRTRVVLSPQSDALELQMTCSRCGRTLKHDRESAV